MKKSPVLTALTALSGGLTGAFFFLAFSHLNDKALSPGGLNPVFLFVSLLVFSVIFPIAWILFSAYFIRAFGADPGKTMKEIAMIFMAPLCASIALIPYVLFYSRLAAAKLKVVGNIYLPFVNYLHVNPAGYFAFALLGLSVVTIASLLLFKFARCLYEAEAFEDRKTARMIFGSLFVFFAVVTSYVTVIYPPTGDEPHYLTISQSMTEDLDINLENNYRQGKYRVFYPVDIDYESIHNTVDKNGKGIYSLHFPGLPALIAVFHRMLGRFGPQIFMNFTVAVLAALFFIFLRGSGINARVSTAAAYIFFTAAPFSIASSLVMTEVPAALLVLYSIMTLSARGGKGGGLLLFAAIAFLPWLHPKLAVFSCVFYLWHYFNVFKNRSFDLKKEAVNNIPAFFSFLLMMAVYYSIFGKFAPLAITSIYKTPGSYFDFSFRHALKGAAAVLFDRDYGLLTYAPVYIAGFFGLAYSLIRDGLKKAAPAAACLPYVVMFLFWNDWGGSMYPARQLIPVLPLAGYYAAYFMQKRSFINKKFFSLLAACSALVSFALMVAPALRYFSGREKIYPTLEKLKFNILWFFPSFSDIITFRHMIIAVYIVIIMLLFLNYAKIREKSHT